MTERSAANLDRTLLNAWVGRQEVRQDIVTAFPLAALSAILDRDDKAPVVGDIVPPLWHWLYFLPIHAQSELGPDGHARRGGFLPPVPLPRRMWAGGRFSFRHPIRVGDAIQRISTITSVNVKQGRAGPLVFVIVRHEISNNEGLSLVEEHDIVYRTLPSAEDREVAPRSAPDSAVWRRDVRPDDVLLFRYSALTFNSHRIHYDRRYVTETENYPGLVVHGPLIATLLAELFRHQQKESMFAFQFRAIRPLFDTQAFSLCGAPAEEGKVDLWAQDAAGNLAMEAQATLSTRSSDRPGARL